MNIATQTGYNNTNNALFSSIEKGINEVKTATSSVTNTTTHTANPERKLRQNTSTIIQSPFINIWMSILRPKYKTNNKVSTPPRNPTCQRGTNGLTLPYYYPPALGSCNTLYTHYIAVVSWQCVVPSATFT